MLGHRALVAEDYFAILKRRRWYILVPLLILPIVAVAITYFIPAQYVSQTLVLIDQQKVPDEYVKPVISSDIDSRLSSMKEQIFSRSRLQPIIERYNLYASGRTTMDDRIDLARKAIAIKPIHSEIAHSGGLPGFSLSFTASDARTAQLVCGEITSLFLGENLRSREASAEGTTDFLKGQLADAKRNLDDQDAKLATFQRQYVGKLPGEETANVNMLTSLNTQLEAATQALARMQQDETYEEAMLSQQIENTQPTVPGGPVSQGMTAAQQMEQTELQGLVAQEADLSAHYTADYPDVIAVRRKIAELRRKIAAEPAPGSAAAPKRVETNSVQQLRAQLRAAAIGIQAKRAEQGQLQNAVRMYQDRIQASPQVEAQYKELTRDYDTAQHFYDDLLTKMNHSKMATDLERRQEGEQFRVMDEPNLPDGPTFPKRSLFLGGGIAAGLLVGLMLAAWLEYKDTALRTERDIYVFTKLPTLAVIAYAGDGAAEGEKAAKLARVKGMFARRRTPPALRPELTKAGG